MLQIASGRFFNATDMYEHAGTGILYSNFSWVGEIETCAATLVPADAMSGTMTTSWVVRYTNRMEKGDPHPGMIVRIGDAELLEQFRLLCVLGLQAFFHAERDVVIHSCRTRPTGRHDASLPSLFVTRLLQPEVHGSIDDSTRLQKFIDSVLHLPRTKYKATISCTRALCDSLVVASYNIHLAYSMLVYTLESLSQQFDGFEPKWENFEEGARYKLDSVLANATDSVADSVKDILTNTQHVKLMTRFVAFTKKYVKDSFFCEECPPSGGALRASDLTHVLKMAYATRSGFVHRLEPIREQICDPRIAPGEVFEWDRCSYLTYRGLVRLVQHVLTNFVAESERLETEKVEWRQDLPDIITLKVAPQYWIWDANRFSSDGAPSFLSGFLEHFNEVSITKGAITDMRAVVKKCIELIPQAITPNKRAMLLLIALFNSKVNNENRVEGWETCFDKHKAVLDPCCIERLLGDIFMGNEWEWSATECANCVEDYLNTRHKKSVLEIPRLQQRALMLGVYNKMLPEGNLGQAKDWAKKALLDEAGARDMQTLIETTAEKAKPFNLFEIMWGAKSCKQGET